MKHARKAFAVEATPSQGEQGECKSASALQSEFDDLAAGFQRIREARVDPFGTLTSTDCRALQQIADMWCPESPGKDQPCFVLDYRHVRAAQKLIRCCSQIVQQQNMAAQTVLSI